MPAVLGLRGSGNFSADERPKNWRESILLQFPNGEAPLTAVSSYLKNEGTDDPEYNWWEKELPTQRFAVNGSHNSAATTIAVSSGAKDCVRGTVLLHEDSGELLLVTSTPTADTSLEVSRSFGAVAAGTLDSADNLVVVSNIHEEGDDPPSARAYSPTKVNNYTQIFRTALYLTRTARRTKLRWDNQGPYREARREALSLHSIEMEKSAIWGEKVETTGDKGLPLRMSGGVLSFLTTNINGSWAIGGLLDEPTFDARMEELFRYGSTEKLVLCGSTFITAINTLAKRNGVLQLVPSSSSYGMKIVEYISAHGNLMLKMHPLFNQHPVWRQNALFLDVKHIVCRPLDDTRFITNRQSNGEDARMDEYLTELGYEWHFEKSHGYMTGVTGGLIS